MRHNIVRAAVLSTLVIGGSLAYALSTGPVASRTGVPGFASKTAEPACNVCHGAGLVPAIPINGPNGQLEILDLPRFYNPNTVYNIRLRLSHQWDTIPPNPVHWGFQMTALSVASGDSAGTWVLGSAPPDSFQIRRYAASNPSIWKRRIYLEHRVTDIHEGASSPVEWHMKWLSPPSDIGKVYFAAAGNAANGDLLSIGSGDFIYTDLESLNSVSNVGVPSPFPIVLRNYLDPPYPNPLRICADIGFTIEKSGRVEVAVFDVSGRRVKTLIDDHRVAGSYATTWGGKREDGTYSANGIYFIRLKAPGETKWISRKITLAH